MSAIDPSPANPKTSREPESSKNPESSLKSLSPHETEDFYEFGPYRLYCHPPVLLRDGSMVHLTPKVLETLKVLVENAGRPVSKEELLRSVWPDTFVEESNLAQNVSVLRKALGAAPEDGAYVETIPKRGYRFVPEVRMVRANATTPAGATETTASPRRSILKPAAAIAAILVLASIGGILQYRRRAGDRAAMRSIAVLPFENLSGDPSQDYVAKAITELLIIELSKALPLPVISGGSALQWHGQPLTSIAQQLKADVLIQGSGVKAGNHVRVNVQLIQPSSGRRLWADSYDRDMTDVLRLEAEIARTVAHQVAAVTLPRRESRPATVNREAFETYLRARYYVSQRTEADLKKAVSLYEDSIRQDPAYAAPYAGLADCYNQLATVAVGARSPTESRKLAMAAAKRALEIDPELAQAHAALAYSNLYEWNWAAAEQGFEQAIRLNPNYPSAHLWLGHYHAARGNFDRALDEVRLAAEHDPLSEITQTQIAWILAHARRYPEAVQQYRKVLADHPRYQWALWVFGEAETNMGQYDAAIEILNQAVEVSKRSPSTLGTLGRALGLAGRRQEAQRLLDELFQLARDRYVPPHAFVHIYIGLGNRDQAFSWLEKSYLERSNSLVWLGVGPMFDPLRADPRFDNLLRRVGLR
jgi:TolB-like protein/DNA-binding winged helix-turn-helix (wHTH) protein/tetratricopeptide (TPR) repeat protein